MYTGINLHKLPFCFITKVNLQLNIFVINPDNKI